ncbi:hypothetical protein ABZ379_26470 [Streptomyces canus]|uniref:hypothetical protein n=1 Tax=Streptomyces canus TaxID=58343 RepID=UPI0033F7B67D
MTGSSRSAFFVWPTMRGDPALMRCQAAARSSPCGSCACSGTSSPAITALLASGAAARLRYQAGCFAAPLADAQMSHEPSVSGQ